ncbi:hypothetical protein [Aquisediminimonas sediminicola]|uniref:hypothetical protein n=1 Tax=Alteraquisediminimonas sediminicola TaxID=2676787 RepID=UPI001C8D359A|nr:hypothetical protein [Aquisediminimonas sediminicola]
MSASNQAMALGKPFNRFITILWQHGGIDERKAVIATGDFIKLASDWMRPKDGPLYWAWTHEWGATNGAHVHILLHVPPRLDPLFRVMPRRWVARLLPQGYLDGAVETKRIRGAKAYNGITSALYHYDVMGRLRYMMKAADPALEMKLGLVGYGNEPWGQSSLIYGKRSGRWQK